MLMVVSEKPLSIFELLFTDELWLHIVDMTNKFADTFMASTIKPTLQNEKVEAHYNGGYKS